MISIQMGLVYDSLRRNFDYHTEIMLIAKITIKQIILTILHKNNA